MTEPRERMADWQGIARQLAGLIQAHPSLAPELAAYTAGLVPGAAYPAMTVAVDPDADYPDDRDEDVSRLVCPYCEAKGDGVSVVDVAERWTRVEEWDLDHEEQIYTVDYSGDGGDFHGYYTKCNACGGPVDMPNGWTEN